VTTPSNASTFLAVIGLACRYPGAPDVRTFWDNLVRGVDSVTRFPAQTTPDGITYRPACGLVDGADGFDAAFFGYSPQEALITDPQQRVFLECAWEALEDAGYDPLAYPHAVGVYAGAMSQEYGPRAWEGPGALQGYLMTGGTGSVVSGRIAYAFGLSGPAVTVDTACSSSLVAVHLACQALRLRECGLALAGGVNVFARADSTIGLFRGGMLALDGRCKSFDASGDGFTRSEGAGVVVLKTLSQARYAAESGLNRATNYLLFTYKAPGNDAGDAMADYVYENTSPVLYKGEPVILSSDPAKSNYPVEAKRKAFAAILIISAELTSQRTTVGSSPA